MLKPAAFAHHIERFNSMEDENVTNFVSNAESWDWLQQNIPFFECPDREVEEMYYFRWWSFRKHLVQTTNGFVITEFLTPVKHAGHFNTISCAAGFHLAEGRWLRDRPLPRTTTRYSGCAATTASRSRISTTSAVGSPPPPTTATSSTATSSSSPACSTIWSPTTASGSRNVSLANGLFWQYDVRDGMEESISGSRTNKNLRPTINSYMFANARAIAAHRAAGEQAGTVA